MTNTVLRKNKGGERPLPNFKISYKESNRDQHNVVSVKEQTMIQNGELINLYKAHVLVGRGEDGGIKCKY